MCEKGGDDIGCTGIILLFMLISFVLACFFGILTCVDLQHKKEEQYPKYRINYMDTNGNVKYTRYGSFVKQTRGCGTVYKDFYSKQSVSTGGAVIELEKLY